MKTLLLLAVAAIASAQSITLTPENPIVTQGSVIAYLVGPQPECPYFLRQFCAPEVADSGDIIVWAMITGTSSSTVTVYYEVEGAVDSQQAPCTVTAACDVYFILPPGAVFDSMEIELPEAKAKGSGRK